MDIQQLEKRVAYYTKRQAKHRVDALNMFREQQERLIARGLTDTQRFAARRTAPSFWVSHAYYLEQKLLAAEVELERARTAARKIDDNLLRHMVANPSQYDGTCRRLAEEILRLRVAVTCDELARRVAAAVLAEVQRQSGPMNEQLAKEAFGSGVAVARSLREIRTFDDDEAAGRAALAEVAVAAGLPADASTAAVQARVAEMRRTVVRVWQGQVGAGDELNRLGEALAVVDGA